MISNKLIPKNLFAVFLLVIVMSNSALSLKCHVCESLKDPRCLTIDPTNKDFLSDCAGPKNKTCRIQEQWIDFDVLNQHAEKRVIRQCASTEFDPSRPCYYRTGFGGKTNVCICLGDACNSATRTASAIFVTLGSFFLLKMFL